MASTVWRGYISFGLISIPVRLFRAARAERVSFRRLYREPASVEEESGTGEPPLALPPSKRTGPGERRAGRIEAPITEAAEPARPGPLLAPVEQVSIRRGGNEVLPSSSVVKGYEYEKDRFVAVEPEELRSVAPKTSASMEIQEFVELAGIDPVYFETSYYVTPEEAGEKAYALLYRSLQITGLVAIAQFAMHSREHVVVVRPGRTGLLAHTMFYASEVRADEEYRTDSSIVNAKELELAQTLIHSLSAPFEPTKYHDTYRERLEAMLAQKVQGLPISPVAVPAKQAEVVDIADALRRSLANLKKPAASEKESKPPARTRKARGSS